MMPGSELGQYGEPSAVREPPSHLKRAVRNFAIDLARGRNRRNTHGGDYGASEMFGKPRNIMATSRASF